MNLYPLDATVSLGKLVDCRLKSWRPCRRNTQGTSTWMSEPGLTSAQLEVVTMGKIMSVYQGLS